MKKHLILWAVIFGTLFSITPFCYANQNPRSLVTDHHIKVIAYNANDVVSVMGSHLVATGIQFDSEESIISIVNGDPLAWTTTVNKATPYILYIKPVLPQSNTNMTVVTNKRIYQFHLTTTAQETAQSKNATYMLSFKYPNEEKEKAEQQLSSLQKTFMGNLPGDPVQWNYNYSFYGSKNSAPIQTVDNGTFTVFKFPKHIPIPAIFFVDAHQNESLVNFRVRNDYVFVQGIYRQFTLRNGEEVTTVYNDSYSVK